MSELATIANLDVSDFEPLSAEEGGWEVIEGDPNARVHTFCENEEIWSGIALVDRSKFEYSAHLPGAIQLLEGAATVETDEHTVEIGPGDVIFLKVGSVSTWTVTVPLREFFVGFPAGADE